MTLAVFLGPSLPLVEARRLLPAARFLPPAAMGDLLRVARETPRVRALALIDGLFASVPSVWHKEVLYAMSVGIDVYGASSMGALRATELRDFGMIGVGQVYDAFASGELEDDDEVAVAHQSAEHDYRATSTAMVSIRAALLRARQEGLLSTDDATVVTRELKALWYPERTMATVFDAVRRLRGDDAASRVRHWLDLNPVDVKAEDARMLLIQLATAPTITRGPAAFDFHRTSQFQRIENRAAAEEAADGHVDELAAYVRVTMAESATVIREALHIALVKRERSRAGTVDAPSSRGHGALSAEELELATGRLRGEVDRAIPHALRALGRWRRVRAHLKKRSAALSELGFEERYFEDARLDLVTLVEDFMNRGGPKEATTLRYASRLGLDSSKAFVDELSAEHLYRRRRRGTRRAP